MLTSESYTLQENKIIDGQIITARGLVVKAKYLCYMKVDTNWYCNQQPKQHVITVPTRTILHPQLEVNAVTYFHTITTSVYDFFHPKMSLMLSFSGMYRK